MMYYMYVLLSERDKSTYVGYSDDVHKRLKRHNEGRSRYTKLKKPWKLIYYEAYLSEKKARQRELQLKRSSWHKKQLFDRLFE